jgi:hypothetical protein
MTPRVIRLPVVTLAVAWVASIALGKEPLESKALAKLRLEGIRSDLAGLKQARRDAARQILEARGREFLAGRGTLKFLFDAIRCHRDAELALARTPGEELATHEDSWAAFWVVATINRDRMEQGRIPVKDYQQSWMHQLIEEIALHKIRTKGGQGPASGPLRLTVAGLLEGQGLPRYHDDPGAWLLSWGVTLPASMMREPSGKFISKELARAKIEAYHADPKELAQKRLQAARIVVTSRDLEFLAGRGTLDFLLEAARDLRDAELALAKTDADQLAALQSYWMMARQTEEVNQERYDLGRVPIQDLLESRNARLDAEIDLIRAWAGKKKSSTNATPLMNNIPLRQAKNLLDAKELARALWEAAQKDPKDLAQFRQKNERMIFAARMKEYLAGRGTLSFLEDSAKRLLDDELAMSDTKAKWLSALEGYWERMARIEEITSGYYEGRRVPFHDLAQTTYFRLDAQIRLTEARHAKSRN